jgi:hypothetical protein
MARHYTRLLQQPGWYSLEREADDYGSMLEMKVEPTSWMLIPN